MLTRRYFGAAALGAAAFPSTAFSQNLRPAVNDGGPALRDLASSHGKFYGSAATTFELKDSAFAPLLASEAGMLVAEYEMKRGVIENVRGRLDFSAGDTLLAFAKAHSMKFRGHALLWHKRNPDWLTDALSQKPSDTVITGYVSSVVGHYRGTLHSWDVVNEAIRPEDGGATGLRQSIWLQTFGERYIDLAFHAAREADPKTLLVYNDQGCEGGSAANDRFRSATLNFLERALKRGVPIDALGLQGHLDAYGHPIDQKKLLSFLNQVSSMGLGILITEHDVDDRNGPSDPKLRDRAVADTSRRFLEAVLDNRAALGVLTWGLSGRYQDAQGFLPARPPALPFDADLMRKPMWSALASALSSA